MPTVPVPAVAREPLELEDGLRHHRGRVEPEVHRRGAGMIAAAVHCHVRPVHPGDRVDDADPVPRVLQDAALLDVRLDPAGEIVEDVDALAPASRVTAGVGGVLPEAAPVVDRPNRLLEVLLGHALGDDTAAEQADVEARALLLEEGDQRQGQAEPELLVQPAGLEADDDAQRAVPPAAVSVAVAVRADPEHRLALRPVAGDEVGDGIPLDREADALELAREVAQGVLVDLRVGIAADRL